KEAPSSNLVPDALFQGGQSYARAKQPALAIDRLKLLVGNQKYQKFKYLGSAYLRLGESQLLLSQPQEAVKNLTIVITKYKEKTLLPQAHFLLGSAQLALKQFDASVVSFTKVRDITDSVLAAKSQFYIGEVYQSKGDFDAALLAHVRVIALYSKDYAVWAAGSTYESGKCYEALSNKADALKAYKSVVADFAGTKWVPLAEERIKALGG
ncbi:MAG: tetratricopeptide repeat protein, partial [Planctomycetia bacterium]|nr:tetratricopeptide repeat protein [Planctomycetia bacterium]